MLSDEKLFLIFVKCTNITVVLPNSDYDLNMNMKMKVNEYESI